MHLSPRPLFTVLALVALLPLLACSRTQPDRAAEVASGLSGTGGALSGTGRAGSRTGGSARLPGDGAETRGTPPGAATGSSTPDPCGAGSGSCAGCAGCASDATGCAECPGCPDPAEAGCGAVVEPCGGCSDKEDPLCAP